MAPLRPGSSQGKKQGQGTTPGPPVTKTRIEVKQFSGDFEQWQKSLIINSAEKVTFRYSTDEPAATSAIWQVSDKPFSSAPQITAAQAPHVIASGALGQVPAKGHVSLFDINFALFAPKTPPTSPKSYWVFIVTKNAQQQPVGLPSVPAKIVYHKSTQPPTDLSGIPGDKPVPMPIEISLSSFTVNITNEGSGDDDPYLFVVAVYADGTTVKPLDLAHSSVRIDSPSKTHNNLGMDAFSDDPKTGKAYSIPSSVGHFEKGILPLSGGLSMQMARNLSRVAILVITMDEDNTSDSAANAGRKALVDNLQKELNAAIRSLKPPDIPAIQEKITAKVVSAVKKETLKDWWTPWGLFDAADPDDFIGSDFATFSYAQILNAGAKGLPIMLDCKSSEGSYTINGTIREK
jgi:hypothetical protein